MVGIVTIVIVGIGIGGVVWMRQRRQQAQAAPVVPGNMARETLGREAFARGNTCLAAGQFTEASTAFHQARELHPKHPYIEARLAEVERQQHAAGATLPPMPTV